MIQVISDILQILTRWLGLFGLLLTQNSFLISLHSNSVFITHISGAVWIARLRLASGILLLFSFFSFFSSRLCWLSKTNFTVYEQCIYCLYTVHALFTYLKLLKINLEILFAYLKIILLQCFPFLISANTLSLYFFLNSILFLVGFKSEWA